MAVSSSGKAMTSCSDLTSMISLSQPELSTYFGRLHAITRQSNLSPNTSFHIAVISCLLTKPPVKLATAVVRMV